MEKHRSYSESSGSIPEEDDESQPSIRIHQNTLMKQRSTKEKFENSQDESSYSRGGQRALKMRVNPLVRDSKYQTRKNDILNPNEEVRFSRNTYNTTQGITNYTRGNSKPLNGARNNITFEKDINRSEMKDKDVHKVPSKDTKVDKSKPKDKKMIPLLKKKSGFKFWSIFSWGCKGKGKVTKPSLRRGVYSTQLRPGMKLGEREIKSECNAKSFQDDSLYYENAYVKTFYVKNKNGDLDIDKLHADEEHKYLKPTVTKKVGDSHPVKGVKNTQKSREAEPGSEVSSMSESDRVDSDEEKLTKRKNSNEETETPESEVSSFLSEKEKEDNQSNASDDEQDAEHDESNKSANSYSSESSESSEDDKKVNKPAFNNGIIRPVHNEKSIGCFQSAEQDEISGGCLPSYRNNQHVSSGCHEITEHNDHEKISKLHSSKRENPVGVPRRSTVMDEGKVWTIEEDEFLRLATHKFKSGAQVTNWSKIAKEVNTYRMQNFFQRSVDECQKRYLEISKRAPQKDWTDLEIQKCIQLYKKYGKSWKLIAKRIPGKTDKQCMYKINSMEQPKDQIKKMNFSSIKDMNNPKYSEYTVDAMYAPVGATCEDREIEKLPSGEQYKHLINSQSGSSSISISSEYPSKAHLQHNLNDRLDVIEEESKAGDMSYHESGFFKA